MEASSMASSETEAVETGREKRSVLYLVRHGECMGNISRKNLLPEDAVLTENGKYQAKLLGELLREERFTVAHCSDYPRALETAQIILSESNRSQNTQLKKDVNLREKFSGIYEGGVELQAILGAFVKSGEEFLDWAPEKAETRADVEHRIENFLQEIFTKIDNAEEPQTVLAVSHGATLLHFLNYLSQTPSKYTLTNWIPQYFKTSPNTGYFKIAVQKNPDPNGPRELEILTAHGNQHLLALGGDTLAKFTAENEKMKSFKGCVQQ